MAIAVTSGKGGVGKSSLALNLAVVWSSRGRRVLVLDADLALGNIHVLLGLSPVLALTDFLTGRASLEETLVRTPSGVDILPAGSGHPEAIDISQGLRDMLIERIHGLVSEYDIVLVDTAPGLTGNVLAFASACDETLIVTTPEPTALSDAYAVMTLLFRRNSETPVRIAVNMASDRATGRMAAECLRTAARRFLKKEVPSAGQVCFDPLVAVAVRRQEPFVTLFPKCPASKELCAIAERLQSAHGSLRPPRRASPGSSGFRERFADIAFKKTAPFIQAVTPDRTER